MEKDIEQSATRRLSERGPPRWATAGHLRIEQMQDAKVELCKGWYILSGVNLR